MEQDKQDIIAELYALRGGLSLISQEKTEKIEPKEKVITKLELEKQKLLEEKKVVSGEVGKIKSAIQKRNSKDIKKLAEKKYETEKKELELYNRNIFRFLIDELEDIFDNKFAIIVAIIFVIGIAGGGFLLWDAIANGTDSFWTSLQYGISYLALGVGGVSFIILFVMFLIGLFKGIKEHKRCAAGRKNLKQLVKDKDQIIENYKNKFLKDKNDAIYNYNCDIDDMNKKKLVIDDNINQKAYFIADSQSEIERIVVQSQGTYDILLKEYSHLLDERDWKNVDLIIYYLETNRADTIKECLQLLDRKLDNEELKNLILKVNTNITQTINNNITKLAGYLGGCFDRLSNQINNYNQTIITTFNAQNEKIANLENKLIQTQNAMLSQQALNTALIAKANQTSEQLMKDSQYMRTLAEQAEIRRRNNM